MRELGEGERHVTIGTMRDELEAKLTAAREQASKLAGAVVAELVA